MGSVIEWMAAGEERDLGPVVGGQWSAARDQGLEVRDESVVIRHQSEPILRLPAHQFPVRSSPTTEPKSGVPHFSQEQRDPSTASGDDHPTFRNNGETWGSTRDAELEQTQRIYRGRTVTMLRRYMRYATETGRLPSLLGREFFRAKVTKYSVVTFEDRVIFVHDMEMCLERLDEFSREIIGRHILQEHDQAATGRLLDCTDRTVRNHVPLALDLLSEILLETGLLERIDRGGQKSCQEGAEGEISVSDCKEGENIF
ncbi:MAG TPA: hypothetical protein VEH47_08580 [Candidatus Acidoferrales bacterium]|nr:hypothetical protein [Candidatus Acidoferrales bacterium]